MKKTTLLIISLMSSLTFVSQASASRIWDFSPPEEYRGKPPMPVTIIPMTLKQLKKYCNKTSWKDIFTISYGCAAFVDEKKSRCMIYVIQNDQINLGWPITLSPIVTTKSVIEHEMAHCNGWPGHHPYPKKKSKDKKTNKR